jgi:hypothetical protein
MSSPFLERVQPALSRRIPITPVNNEYVVGPGSIHPTTGEPYEALNDSEIIEAPDWLIAWLISQKIAPVKTESPRQEGQLIPHGSIHGYMLTEAGKLRHIGLSEEQIYPALSELVHKSCAPPIDESRIRAMAKSICNFPAGSSIDLIMTQSAAPASAVPVSGLPVIDTSTVAMRPVFPHWVMKDTILWDCLVGPAIETSSKYPEFIFIPALQLFLNYLSGKISIGDSTPNLNLFVGLISPYGQFFKSSSCTLAQDFFQYMGMARRLGRDVKAAEGKVILGAAGSPEGFGVALQKIDASNAIMFNDELGKSMHRSIGRQRRS